MRTSWSIITIQGILSNDFYIGTLRQHKYRRKKINGSDVKVSPEENYVFENHHEPIIDNRTWLVAQDLLKQRTTSHYRGIKKLESSIKSEATELKENESAISLLERHLLDAKEELKAVKKRKIKELAKLDAWLAANPEVAEQIEIIEETYVDLEDELTLKISGLLNQINLTADKRNDIIRINRLARTVIDVFNDTLEKPALDKMDLQLIMDSIVPISSKKVLAFYTNIVYNLKCCVT